MNLFSKNIFTRIFGFVFLAIIFVLLPFFSYANTTPVTGYAWGENTGWVKFPDPATEEGGVYLNDAGVFTGYAWGENIGWLSFNCSNTSSCATSDFKVSVTLASGGVCPSGRSYQPCPVCESSPSDTTPPIVTEISSANISQNSVQVTWRTNEITDSVIEYGVDTTYKFLTGNAVDISAKTLFHSVDLKNLLPDTVYHFKIISRDAAGNIFTSEDQIFKTLPSDKFDTPSNSEGLRLVLPEEAIIKNLTNSSVSVSWQTDVAANSLARIKSTDAPEGAWQEIGDTSVYSTDHLVNLTGLISNTEYQYQVKSSSSSGSVVVSKIKIFKTKPAPVISEVLVSDITLDSAIVSWKTNFVSTTFMDYGYSLEYGFSASGTSEDLVTTHEIKLKNLESGATYNFRVKGKDDSGNLIVSDNYSFKTYALPLINKYNIEGVKDTFVVINWTSNTDIDSLVIYNNLKTGESRTQGDTKLTQEHNLKLENLDSGTDYAIKIEGRDIFGNIAKGPEINIKTLLDTIAPSIANVRTYATMMSVKGKAQMVVVWKTDEQSTSKVYLYNVADTVNPVYSSQFDSNLTTNHTVIITDLNLGTSYRLRIESADKTGNSGLSQDFAVLTPIEKKSIIMIILEQFEKIFSWTSNMNL